jgi:hypothetical protein
MTKVMILDGKSQSNLQNLVLHGMCIIGCTVAKPKTLTHFLKQNDSSFCDSKEEKQTFFLTSSHAWNELVSKLPIKLILQKLNVQMSAVVVSTFTIVVTTYLD